MTVSDYSIGETLINELLIDSLKFVQENKEDKLLGKFFNGFPVDKLKPLLKSDNLNVQGVAVFIASELGIHGKDLLYEIIPLLDSDNGYIRADALDVVMMGTVSQNFEEFLHIILTMTNPQEFFRIRAMQLIANANGLQLEAALESVDKLAPDSDSHEKGIVALLKSETLLFHEISAMIDSADFLIRKYGSILAVKLYNKYPNLIIYAASSSDTDVQKFANDFIELQAYLKEKL